MSNLDSNDVMKSHTGLHSLCLITGSNNVAIIRKMMEVATDMEHILLLYNPDSPTEGLSPKAIKAIESKKSAGCVFSKNESFMRICARVAYGLSMGDPLPVKEGICELELFGAHLDRLIDKAGKRDALLKDKIRSKEKEQDSLWRDSIRKLYQESPSPSDACYNEEDF